MSLLNFDATRVEPTVAMELVPAGKYVVEISNSTTKETKAKNGSYLELEMTILEGEHKGRKLWDRLCLNHVNPKTQRIAQANLSAICHAVNVLQPRDSVDLHNLPFEVNVRVRENENTGESYNEVRGYAKRERNFAAPASGTASNTDSAPWAR
ncbi:MAG: DUF669 domain-containing protein [Thermoguttaceae bacterium]|nr:DUF669 domain-containing protein [Thermoguttaceae bacterium]